MKLTGKAKAVTVIVIALALISIAGCKKNEVNGLEVSPANLILKPNQSYQLQAVVSPDNADNKNVKWSPGRYVDLVSVTPTGFVQANGTNTRPGQDVYISCITEEGFIQKNVPVVIGNFAGNLIGGYFGKLTVDYDKTPIDRAFYVDLRYAAGYPQDSAVLKFDYTNVHVNAKVGITNGLSKDGNEFHYYISGEDKITVNGKEVKVTIEGFMDPYGNYNSPYGNNNSYRILNFTAKFVPYISFSELKYTEGEGEVPLF